MLNRLRAIIGPDVPIEVTLDLHTMVTPVMVAQALIMVSDKTYLHIDMRKTGRHGAGLLDAVLHGQTQPATLRAHGPMLDEANSGRTNLPQTAALHDRATLDEADPVSSPGRSTWALARLIFWKLAQRCWSVTINIAP